MKNVVIGLILFSTMILTGCGNWRGIHQGCAVPCLQGNIAILDVDTDSSTGNSSIFDGSVDEDTTGWSAGAGLKFHKNLAAEVKYNDFDNFRFDGLYMGTPSSGKVEADGWSASVVGSIPVIPDYGVEVYGKVGMLWWDAKERGTFGGAPDNDSDSGEDVIWGIGVQAPIGNTPLSIRAGYSETEIWDNDVDILSAEIIYGFSLGE